MCRDAGFPNVLAHYKPVPSGMSHNGKAIPALCWDHKHGKVPRHISETPTPTNGMEALVEQTHREIATEELCGCGRPVVHKGRCSARRNAQAKPQALARSTVAAPVNLTPKTRTKSTLKLTLPEVLANLANMLELHRAEVDEDLEAIRRVVRMVHHAEESDAAAEFLTKNGLTSAL